jgi:glucan biosynthesis protein C
LAAQAQVPLLEFYPFFLTNFAEILASQGQSGGCPVWIDILGLHLWFIGFLFLFSVLGLPQLQWLRSDSSRAFVDFAARVATYPLRLLLFAVPVSSLSLVGDLVAFDEGTTSSHQSWGAFLWYFAIFVLGALLYCDSRILDAVRRYCSWLLITGIAALGVFAYLSYYVEATANVYLVIVAIAGLMEWCLSLVLLRIGMAVLDRGGNALQYCLGIVVAFYVLHWPIVTTIAYWITQKEITLKFI